jgi:hypothetical protein
MPFDLDDLVKLASSSHRAYRRRPHFLDPPMGRSTGPPDLCRGWNEVRRVLPGPLDIPSDVSDGQHSSCETSTCVRDLARDAWPGGTRHRSNMRGPEEKFEGARNSRADRRSIREEFFYCVTTRPLADQPRRQRHLALPSSTPLPLRLRVFLPTFGRRSPLTLPPGRLPSPQLAQTVRLPAVPLPPVARLVTPPAAFAQAGAPSQPPRSGRHTPFHRMLNMSHGRLWLLLGQPGEDPYILLGPLPIHVLIRCPPTTTPRPSSGGSLGAPPRRRNTEGDQAKKTKKASHSAGRNQARTKEIGKETVQTNSGLKGKREGDGWANPRC